MSHEYGVRHRDGRVTVHITGHAFPDEQAAGRRAAQFDEGECDECGSTGWAHGVVWRPKPNWSDLAVRDAGEVRAPTPPLHERTLVEHLASGEPISPVLTYLAQACGHYVANPTPSSGPRPGDFKSIAIESLPTDRDLAVLEYHARMQDRAAE